MQCFLVGYSGKCNLLLLFTPIYTRSKAAVPLCQEYKCHTAYFTVSHEKTLHNFYLSHALKARRLVFAWVGSFSLKTDRSKMDVGFQAQKQPKANGVLKYFFTKRSEY